tara:strand:- start:3968 stop:5848 length:1881 start_codon:yes stop_codon:yes gene_type:complete
MKTINLILILGFLTLIGCSQGTIKDSIRDLKQGTLIGMDGENDTYVWKGIPFAEPPVGELRWKAPKRPAPWKGVLEATEFSSACFQPVSIIEGNTEPGKKWEGSEDCLYLNVWSPKLSLEEISKNDGQLPVMMWIHGGGNTIGATDIYDPSLLVSEHNLIVVTVQYRMGPLGWFRHPSLSNLESSLEDKSGNYGTLDNLMALRWIQENISSFGGDLNNVTVFGESAGGHNTAAIFASPLAAGLFHKAIIESGIVSHSSISESESYMPKNKIAGTIGSKQVLNEILLNSLEINSQEEATNLQESMSDEDISKRLRGTSPSELLEASKKAEPFRKGMTRVFPDGHVIPLGGINDAFVNKYTNKVPIIFGTNKDENKFFNSLNPRFVKWEEASGLYSAFGSLPKQIIDPDYYDAVSFYGSAFWKQRAADTPASQLVNSGHNDTYVYRFDWDELPEFNGMNYAKLFGSAHAMEIIFVMGGALDSLLVKQFIVGKEAYPAAKKLSNQMMSYWAEFAYTGSPGKGRSNDLPIWSSWNNDQKYIILDSENDQGIIMSNQEYTQDFILSELIRDERLSMKDKCETLFGTSYRDGDGVSKNSFQSFAGGLCINQDYSDLIKEFDSEEERFIGEDS